MSVNVFLPCRRGSQRVPHKNTKPIGRFANGLLELKLLQLSSTREIDRIFVSSDDEKVLGFAQSLKNAKIITHKRDENLCASSTSTDSLIAYARELIGKGEILWTHVTSPFFGSKQYSEAIERYRACLERGYDSLMSVNALYGFLWDSGKPINYDRSRFKWPQTQNLTPIFEVNSACFLANARIYRTQGDRIGQKPYLYITDKITGFDVDWQEDFALAHAILEFAESQRVSALHSPAFGGGVIAYRSKRESALIYTQSFCLHYTLNTQKSNKDSKKLPVCSRSGASEDSLLASGSKFARTNLHKMISPSSVYSKGANPNRVPDALTLRILESRKDCSVCSRSGGNGGLAPIADTQVLRSKTCSQMIRRAV